MSDITRPTVIQMKAYDTTVTYELENSDRNISELIHGFVTCCIGLTWHRDTILEGLKDYVVEHSDEDEVF